MGPSNMTKKSVIYSDRKPEIWETPAVPIYPSGHQCISAIYKWVNENHVEKIETILTPSGHCDII